MIGDNLALKFSPPSGFLNKFSSPNKGKMRAELPNYVGPHDFNAKGVSSSYHCVNER